VPAVPTASYARTATGDQADAGVAFLPFRPGAAGGLYDTLVVRAVALLAKLFGWFEPIAESFGRLLVIKGPRWEEELAEARERRLARRVSIRPIASWPLRGTDNENVLLEVRQAG
jgi:16S rRNA G527 N7-methylase RsmG